MNFNESQLTTQTLPNSLDGGTTADTGFQSLSKMTQVCMSDSAQKSAKGLKPPKLKSCKVCRAKFIPAKALQCVCGLQCALSLATLAKAKRERSQATQERRETKAKLEKLKSRADWAREAQAEVNRYVRFRDIGKGCITCGAKPEQKAGGTMDAGHFRSVGSAPHLRFFTSQIAAQCVTCNRYKGGRALDFRRALVELRGAEWVEQLEAMQGVAKFDIDYLKRIKTIFAKKSRRLEKRING
jgi:hypothetical protein